MVNHIINPLKFLKTISFKLPIIAGVILLLYWHVYDLKLSWKNGSCGRENTIVFYRHKTDYKIGCNGISRAERFFKNFGFSTDTPIAVFFEFRVPVDQEIYDPDQIWGYFSIRSLYVLLPSNISPFLNNTGTHFFRVEVNKKNHLEELITSTVAHEIAHLLTLHNFEIQTNLPLEPHLKQKMGTAVQEYIASIVQFCSMQRNYREEIIAQFDPNLIFNHEQEINNLLFSHSPQEFYIMSYRHFLSKDSDMQREILDRIFTNKLNPDSVFEINL